MKEIWSRTFELFRRHFVLWVPCSIAAILMLVLGQLDKALLRWLMRFFAEGRSVLGGEVPVGNLEQARHRALMFISPLGFLREFLEICFFVVALVATGNLVLMVLEEQRPDLMAALRASLPRFREIILLSLKYMAVMAVILGLLVILGSSPLTSDRVHELFLSKAFVSLLGLASESCLAWLLVPSTIRLLRPPGNPAVSSTNRKLGTMFAVAASAAGLALEYLVSKAETSIMLEKRWEGEAIAVMNAVIVNAPMVLLFIALTLLAYREMGEGHPL